MDLTESIQAEKDQKLVRRTTMLIALLGSFIFPFAGSSLVITLPAIGHDFHVAAASLPWVMSAMMLTNITLSIPCGRFADLWNKRKMFNTGILVFGVATLLSTFSPNFEILVFLRVIQGVGGAMLASTNMAILVDAFPANQRGRVLGLAVMCTYIGLSLGPVVGGFITSAFSWRAVFLLTSGVTLITYVVAITSATKLPKTSAKQASDLKLNPLSITLYMLATFVFMFGFTSFGQHVYSFMCLGLGLILLVVFACHELKAAKPVIEMRLFKGNLNFVFSSISALLNYAAVGTLGFVLSLYLVKVRGYPENIAGLILIIQPTMMALVSPFMGRLSDKRSPFIISSLGMGICAVAMVLFLFLREDTSLVYVIVSLLIAGFGVATFASPNSNAIMSCVSPKDYGVSNSVISTMRLLGQQSSMAVITIVTFFTVANVPIAEAATAQIMSAFHTIFIVFALACVLGVLLSLGRRKRQ